MPQIAAAELQTHIDKIRHEAFAAGYAVAMKAVQELASQPARTSLKTTAAPNHRDEARGRRSASVAKPNRSRRPRANNAVKTIRRLAATKSYRGTNALRVEEVLRAASPRAFRPAAIRKALQEKGVTISFPSLRHALHQLAARKAARQVGSSRTWRYRPSA